MRALQKAQAPRLPTKQLFSLTLPLFGSIDFQPIHFAHHFCVPDPGCDRPVRKRTCITGKFTSRSASNGKPKVLSKRLFFGQFSFYIQISAMCCNYATFLL